jgi:hypothetical protein
MQVKDTSLLAVSGRRVSRVLLLGAILSRLEQVLNRPEQEGFAGNLAE